VTPRPMPRGGYGEQPIRRPYEAEGTVTSRPMPRGGYGEQPIRRPYEAEGTVTPRPMPRGGYGEQPIRRPVDQEDRARPIPRPFPDGQVERRRPFGDGGIQIRIGLPSFGDGFRNRVNGTSLALRLRGLFRNRNLTGLMCDSNGRPRGRTGSAYVARLIAAGRDLQPCNRTRGTGLFPFGFLRNITQRILGDNSTIRNMIGNIRPTLTNLFQRNVGQNARRQDSEPTPVREESNRGQNGAMANDPGSSTYSAASKTAGMAVGGILLVIVGVMFAAILIVLNIRLAQMLRA